MGLSLGINLGLNGGGNGIVVQDLLEDVLSQTEFDILATDSETTVSVTVTASSGATASDYSLILGDNGGGDTDEPGFDTNKWTFDGGDFLTQPAGLTTFQQNLHKTTGGQAATIGIVFKTPVSFGSAGLWDTSGLSGNGVKLSVAADGRLLLRQLGDSNGDNWTIHAGLSASTTYCIFVGFDFTTNSTVRHWINTVTGTNNTDSTGNTSTTSPSGDRFRVGADARDAPPSTIMPAGYEVFAVAGFTGVLSDANIATAHANWEQRISGLDCTP